MAKLIRAYQSSAVFVSKIINGFGKTVFDYNEASFVGPTTEKGWFRW